MHFILVHGAWHGAWCWRKTIDALEAMGHRAEAPDLDIGEPVEVVFEQLADVVAARDQVTLVGHSLGGMLASVIAERLPEHLERLAFLAAFAPRNGESVASLGRNNLASALRGNVEENEEGRLTVNDRIVRAAFYADCDDATADDAISRLRPQHPSAFSHEVQLSTENYGRVPTQYIECVEDQAVHVSLQRQMARAIDCTLINSLRTSHSPFLSTPEELAGLLALSGPPPA